jgi:hypothetical protein
VGKVKGEICMCDRMAEVTHYGCILRDFPLKNSTYLAEFSKLGDWGTEITKIEKESEDTV